MTAKAAICKALLLGRVLNIKNGFTWFGVTNIPREIGRGVERAFNVKCERTNQTGTTRYLQPCEWIDYKLYPTQENLPGIKLMVAYILKEEGDPKTEQVRKEQDRLKKYL